MKIPIANKIPHEDINHGHKRIDNYHWLRDKNWKKFIEGDLDFENIEVKNYLEKESKYTKFVMDDTNDLQMKLYKEMLSRVNEDDSSTPMKFGDYFYYSKTKKGHDYSFLCRKYKSLDAEEEIYFDINEKAKGLGYYSLGARDISSDNLLMAYAENITGSLSYQIRIRNLESGIDLPLILKETGGDVVWSNDFKHLYFIERHPVNGRGHKVFVVNVFEGVSSKKLVFEKEESLSNLYMNINKSSNDDLIFIELGDTNSNTIYYLDAYDFSSRPILFNSLLKDVSLNLDFAIDKFYILTNDDEKINNRLFTCDKDFINRSSWELLVGYEDKMHLKEFHLYENYIALEYQNNIEALPKIIIKNLINNEQLEVKMKDEAYSLDFLGALEFKTDSLMYLYQSPITPSQTISYNLTSKKLKIIKQKIIPNFESSNYIVKRKFVVGHDGEKIPLTIISKKEFIRDSSSPCYIYSYGSYGYSMTTYFSSNIFSLVDRGFSYAIAHIRGGSDKGYKWYLDGKLNKKKNTFLDFISCTEYLIENNYTGLGLVSANGGSAGGLLMGAIANMRPELYRTIVLDVPFVDVVSTILDKDLPLTPPEWNEWGNPIINEDAYKYMLSYSPYDNIKAINYPNMLLNSGITDEQVTYWEPTKMVAKLRELKTDNNTLLLNVRMTAGHAGSSARYEALKEKAFSFAFILKKI